MSIANKTDMQEEFAHKAKQIQSSFKAVKMGLLVLFFTCISPVVFQILPVPVDAQLILIGGGAITSLILGSPAIWIRYCTQCPNCSKRFFLDESKTFQFTGKCGFCGTRLHKDGDVTGWNKYFK